MIPSLFAVIGKPVLHSRSPQLFHLACRLTDRADRYLRLACSSTAEALEVVRELPLQGINVTAPFKEEMAAVVDELDDTAARLGAINTVVQREGRLYGFNTDVDGVRGTLREHGIAVSGRRVVVLGAGGAAKAAAMAAQEEGAEVVLAGRTPGRTRAAANQVGATAVSLRQAAMLADGAALIVSSLPADAAAEARAWLAPGRPVLDAVYAGGEMRAVARSMGCPYIDGADWLRHQAAAAFRHFTGQEVAAEALRPAMAEEAPPIRHIALTGFMGCGKSSLGRRLAESLGREFFDTDQVVEQHSGRTVTELFAAAGEAAFRQLEHEALREVLQRPAAVLALGGGTLLEPRNRGLLRSDTLTVWLWCNAAETERRTQGPTRPLLQNAADAAARRRLFEARLPGYTETADLLVVTSRHSGDSICHRIEYEMHKTNRA